MIKIIKPGTLREVTCNNCVEAYKRQQQYIICPQCKNKIVLNAAG